MQPAPRDGSELPPFPVSALMRAYRVPAGHFDELQQSPGRLRPHWATFFAHAGALGPEQLTEAHQRVTRQLLDNGVTYNVHSDGAPRAWSLDVLPHIVPADEWDEIGASLRQLARLLDAMAADIYGPQQLLAEGLLPAALVLGHRGFLRSCYGFEPASGIHLHLVGFDLARDQQGRWRVMAIRAQAPSGAGYALENRLTISRLFPDAFRELRVERLAPFFRTLQETLLDTSPHEDAPPHIVLLSPGPYNETYFEHAYLSRYLGFTLAEGADLAVRDDRVYLKTVAGLRAVHGILRRLDDDFCDPLELRADSRLGVAGLVQAWRTGAVTVANAFGLGWLESAALPAFLPAIAERLLDEPLQAQLPHVCWCGDRAAMERSLAHLHEFLIRPTIPDGHSGPVRGADLDTGGYLAWTGRIRSAPEQFALEQDLALSHTPVWTGGDTLTSRPVLMRVFLAADGRGDYRVLPGGLSRLGRDDFQLVSGQRGGGSKDTWILSNQPVERFSMLPGRMRIADITGRERMVSSRAGEHLFWMGRYAERSENTARLLRAILSRIDQGDPLVSSGSDTLLTACRRHGLLPASASDARDGRTAPSLGQALEQALIHGMVDATERQSLAYNVRHTVRVAGTVRDRLSTDNWRVLNQLADSLAHAQPRGLAEALDLLDRTVLALVAVGGLEMAHMTRDDGWRFMSLGRHLERLHYVVTTVADVAASNRLDDPALLEWLLDLSDSIITYRARYMGRAEWLPAADLLLFDDRNPRSAAFQLGKLAKHVPLLPRADLHDIVAVLEQLARRSLTDIEKLELFPGRDAIGEFLSSCEQAALKLSDALTLRYFSHVYEPARAMLL